MKLNFWESFAFSTALAALQALVGNSGLSTQQKADLATAITDVQKVQADFAV